MPRQVFNFLSQDGQPCFVCGTARLSLTQWHCQRRSQNRNDVGPAEIVSFEQERLARHPRQRVGEAVAEIQPCRKAAFAEIMESLSRQMRLLNCDGLDHDSSPPEEHVALAKGLGSGLTFDNNGEFDEVGGADQAAIRVMDSLRVEVGFRLAEEDGGQS